ncbi:RadC family protein [Rhodoflexus caldus]|uniref:RadC family protein n=1 Tax=Rhodoflexus caldus TaxID=2891236 RepID=UPI00202AA1EA|nr:DNA repair protein RadC [Rhodoflexus caldus]
MNSDFTPIKHWAEDDRPREKLLHKGRAALSDAELIAILLGTGTTSLSAVDLAKQILSAADNNLYNLARFSIKDLQKFKGIGEAKAITIAAALELGRRRKETEVPKRVRIRSSRDCYEAIRPHLADIQHEEFWILLLSRANEIMQKVNISSGGVSGTVVDPKIIFKTALEHTASGLILVHNHPSGNLTPSQADIDLTAKLIAAGKVLEITVLDHLIYTDNGYFSFMDEGMMH